MDDNLKQDWRRTNLAWAKQILLQDDPPKAAALIGRIRAAELAHVAEWIRDNPGIPAAVPATSSRTSIEHHCLMEAENRLET